MQAYCVIDIGGTTFRYGSYKNNKVYGIKKIATPNYLQYSDVESIQRMLIDKIIEAYFEKSEEDLICKLGVSFPGPTNEEGEVIGSSVIFGGILPSPYKVKEQIKAELQKRGINIDILVVNDLTASAWRYSDRDCDPFCLITVSSGIGNKIFSNGKLLIDNNGISGEIGHSTAILTDVSIPCTCGWGANHVGMISSGRGIEYFGKLFAGENEKFHAVFAASALAQRINNDPDKISNELIAQFADKTDIFSKAIIDYCTNPLADCICLLLLALYLKKIILIGGFALNCDYYLESLRNNVIKKGIYNFSPDDIKKTIILGEKDDNHALIGLGKMLSKR